MWAESRRISPALFCGWWLVHKAVSWRRGGYSQTYLQVRRPLCEGTYPERLLRVVGRGFGTDTWGKYSRPCSTSDRVCTSSLIDVGLIGWLNLGRTVSVVEHFSSHKGHLETLQVFS